MILALFINDFVVTHFLCDGENRHNGINTSSTTCVGRIAPHRTLRNSGLHPFMVDGGCSVRRSPDFTEVTRMTTVTEKENFSQQGMNLHGDIIEWGLIKSNKKFQLIVIQSVCEKNIYVITANLEYCRQTNLKRMRFRSGQ